MAQPVRGRAGGRVGLVAMVASLTVLLTSCSDIYPLGVEERGDNTVIVFPSCADVYGAGLFEERSNGTTVRLWAIHAETGSSHTEFVIGETPPGFEVIEEFQEPPDGAQMVVWVDPHGDGPGPTAETTFTWGELEPERLWSDGAYLSHEQLSDEIADSILCDGGWTGFGREAELVLAAALGAWAVLIAVLSLRTVRAHRRRTT